MRARCVPFLVAVVAASAALLAATATAARATTEDPAFAAWLAEHRPAGFRFASEAEHALRLKNFRETVARVSAKNARALKLNSTARYHVGPMADLSPAEFREKYLMPARPEPQGARFPKEELLLKPQPQFANKAAPASIDWRERGAVTAVKNQAQCGSCWAFSATEEIESQWILAGKATNTTVNLAPQQIVDCDDTSMGCGGGETESAYNYVMNAGGLEGESSYPYTGQDGTCNFQSRDVVATISSYKYATSDYDESTLQANLLSWGPISVCLDASNWQDYHSGVMTWTECAWINLLDHCVQLVGYNTNNGNPYWIVRNSWTTSWGINGYIWLEMWEDTCGIAHDATSVVIN